mmetsp:Transcript_8122/g.11608  ORF Transcript_8122/g.11608 Transcript_8122/m.11608 type:complete len:788 (-) Transcript_8122:423-2786(-)|eukprot:CAMPEP_0184866114 /NCGR_PEP_ID=MMETSP0580-20130426/20793_1 /TAXON_ID=1118495 /ORGANISM="Dactyliosolen fragilissimus" /LENGTH=787 /DNA_ID=CAMNT_0027365591 /DNA_START=40 /DNA_END=2403 /DNA_ORIENTATION=+
MKFSFRQTFQSESNTYSPALKALASEANLCVPHELHVGTHVKKVNNLGVAFPRYLHISKCNSRIILSRKRYVTKIILDEKKIKTIHMLDISHVHRGFVGSEKFESLKTLHKYKAENFLTIFFNGGKTVALIMPSKEICRKYYDTISDLLEVYRNNTQKVDKDELLLFYVWPKRPSESILWQEAVAILKRLNFQAYSSDYKKIFKSCTISLKLKKTSLNHSQFLTFLKKAKTHQSNELVPEDFIWKSLAGNKDTIPYDDFMKFLKDKQAENNLKYLDTELKISKKGIDKPTFDSYLYGELNNAFDFRALRFDESTLDKPLGSYWINTSHNTYLTADQVKSNSSVEMYLTALDRGCKCVELDTWDGGHASSKPVPVIYHGHTLTSKINMEDVIICIKNYVEENPETYPIILSFENHCSEEFQVAMANILTSVLGDILYIPTDDDLEGDLPSPANLRGKVVIKGKRPPQDEDDPDSDSDDDSDEEEQDKEGQTETKMEKTNSSSSHKKKKFSPELTRLVLLYGKKFSSFDESLKQPDWHMHSIKESKRYKFINKSKDKMKNLMKWREYNTKHLTRTYPKGTRLYSSNFNPLTDWSLGCQMVALNFQTYGAPMVMNDGRFRANGGCGYVLKPRWLLPGGSLRPAKQVKFRIRVLGAARLPKPMGVRLGEYVDPYVVMTVFDLDTMGDYTSETEGVQEVIKKYHSDHISNNGFCPVWKDEKFTEFTVLNPDIAMLCFKVKEKDTASFDDFIGAASIPVSALKKGYRNVPLYANNDTQHGPFHMASVFVEIEI